MRKTYLIVFIAAFLGCNSEKKTNNETASGYVPDNETETRDTTDPRPGDIVSEFLTNIRTLERVKDGNPVTAFQRLAKTSARKISSVSRYNIGEILSLAGSYNNCVITTGNHTIVKIIDLSDCVPSGSWGVCMPYASGYIKRGGLILHRDYLNNIIGTPDSQLRKAYFF